ncbi:MAG: glycosyltransferase family 4 protein [Flavobacteriaceae bacterium]|nr:glycosyltransferase family 4 protein [Flavobacteriaceae bacterium]
MKLAIISHTAHYKDASGTIVGWGPTITEINHLAAHFEHIYHVAFLHSEVAPPSAIPYCAENITFVPLPPSGGNTILSKLSVLKTAPIVIKTVQKTLKKVDAFQLRTPIGMGVYLIPWLTLFSKKTGWFKYAGNWKQDHAPWGYALQRWMLKKQHRVVTINGSWEDQPAHCLTFENPCLTETERIEGNVVAENKDFSSQFSFCFVGRLEDEKGVQRILDAFALLPNTEKIKQLHFVGNGEKFEVYRKFANEKNLPATFHGFLARDKVFEIYRKSHFLLLPSTASEGFPKVIAEAMNFGCLPIVSKVSSIAQYIEDSNGFIVDPVTTIELKKEVFNVIDAAPTILKSKALKAHQKVDSFTFEYYNNRILSEIVNPKSN